MIFLGVTRTVENIEKSKEFYEKILGFKPDQFFAPTSWQPYKCQDGVFLPLVWLPVPPMRFPLPWKMLKLSGRQSETGWRWLTRWTKRLGEPIALSSKTLMEIYWLLLPNRKHKGEKHEQQRSASIHPQLFR